MVKFIIALVLSISIGFSSQTLTNSEIKTLQSKDKQEWGKYFKQPRAKRCNI